MTQLVTTKAAKSSATTITRRAGLVASSLLAATTVATFNSARASAYTVVQSSITDLQFQQLLINGTFAELFVAEGRIADNNASTASSNREMGINRDVNPGGGGGAPVADAGLSWGNGSGPALPFTLTYNGSRVDFTMGGTSIFSTEFSGPVNQIFLRTRAGGGTNTTSATATLSNLLFTTPSTPPAPAIPNLTSSGAGSAADVDYLIISGNQVNNAFQPLNTFTLTGNALFAWTGTRPINSATAFQIKVGNGKPEPIPTPALLPGLIGMGVAAWRKRKGEQIAKSDA